MATATATGTNTATGAVITAATATATAADTSATADAAMGAATASPPSTDVHYTVFIRLPFARGRFVDPPSVEWDAAKDRALWKILSNTPPKRGALNWNEISTRFNVPLPFILQQAAWLYERQLSQVKAQMRKVGGGSGGGTQNASSHAPGMPGTPGVWSHNSGAAAAVNVGEVQVRRPGSAGSRDAPSSLAGTSRDGNASVLAGEKSGSGVGIPQATGLRRLQTVPNSKVTEAQREISESPRQSGNLSIQRSASTFPISKVQSVRRTTSPESKREPAPASSSSGEQAQNPHTQNSKSASGSFRNDGDGDGDDDDNDLSSTSSSNSSSDSSANYDSATYPIRRSQIFRQPPRFSSKKRGRERNGESSYSDDENKNDNGYDDYDGNADNDDDDDDDENPTFLPFAQQRRQTGSTKQQEPEQQSSASATPTATTFRSRPGLAGGSFGRLRQQQQREQIRAQKERKNENSIVSSEGSPLSSSDAATSTYKSFGVGGESASTSTKNATATTTITGREKVQARAAESTTPAISTRLSRHHESKTGRSTQSPAAGTGTGILQLSSKPATSKPTQPQTQPQHHSSSGSNSYSSNSNTNNNKQTKHRIQNTSQDPSQNQSQTQSQTQSRNHSQTQSSQPHRADPAAQLSPRQRALRRRENNPGSDGGTPSMGSSFSDLDDTSVTQSALEEALLSNMQRRGGGGSGGGSSIGTAVGGGAIASRMSSLSQALRSKYL